MSEFLRDRTYGTLCVMSRFYPQFIQIKPKKLCTIDDVAISANDCLMGTTDPQFNFPTFKGKVIDKIKDRFSINFSRNRVSIYKKGTKKSIFKS